ncbi:MAG TPA: prepilin-type N-terminal cleavage/methylation domain-containing protein [Candidatus Paceibacterota bacterium]
MVNGKCEAGFTLLETLVAVAILMIAIGSAFGLAPQGLMGARFAKNQTIANYLAQDALETVHNIRDNSMFFSPNPGDPYNWLSGFSECQGGKWCTVDTINNTVAPCLGITADSCPPLDMIQTKTDGGVAYGNGPLFRNDPTVQNSIFNRAVTIENIPNNTIASGNIDTEALVTVRVTWQEGKLKRQAQTAETLFDWWTTSK